MAQSLNSVALFLYLNYYLTTFLLKADIGQRKIREWGQKRKGRDLGPL